MATIDGVGSVYDFALNGKGYLIDTLDQESPFEYRAYTREPVPLRLPRIDTSPEPGENSLGDLWVRSQHNWGLGHGQEVFDGEQSSHRMYRRGSGIDPFVHGGSIFPGEKINHSNTNVKQVLLAVGDLVYMLDSTTTIRRMNSALTVEDETITAPYSDSLALFHNVTADDTKIYYGTASGIKSMVHTDAFGAWTETEAAVNNLTNVNVLRFAKGRLIACKANAVHVIDDLTSLTSGSAAHYPHMDTSWEWTDVEDISQGVYLAGYNAYESRLYLMTFDTSDAAAGLTIGIPREVWRAHGDERILCVKGYAGSAMLLGTTKGVRNCIVVDREGNVAVGPLVSNIVDNPAQVAAIDFHDGYAFWPAGIDGGSYFGFNFFSFAKMDLSSFSVSNFAIALGDKDSASQAEADLPIVGLGIVIPPWYNHGKGLFASAKVISSVRKYAPYATNELLHDWFFATGDLRFGSSVEKEIRRLEITLDPQAFYFTFQDAGTSSLKHTPTSGWSNADMWVVMRCSLTDWSPASGDHVLIGQMNSLADFKWTLKVNSSGNLVFEYADSGGTTRTATSASAMPALTETTAVWLRVRRVNTSQVHFSYWIPIHETRYPNESDWISLGAAVASAFTGWKSGSNLYPFYIGFAFDTASGYFNHAEVWTGQSYPGATADDRVLLTPLQYNPDLEGNVWSQAPSVEAAGFNVQYSLDGTPLEALYSQSPDAQNLSISFPDDTVAHKIELLFQSYDLTDRGFGGFSLAEWRLLAEPVPAPRFYRHYVPVHLYDYATKPNSRKHGKRGKALEQMLELDTLYRAGTAVDFQPPYWRDTADTIKVRVEAFEFKQYAQVKGARGFGGVGLLILKEIDT